jgi:hypothetical protein
VRSCEYAYRIMFAGAFSGGKSTLINALMDHPDLLPTEDLPYTGVVTFIRKGNHPAFSVRYLDRESCFRRFSTFMEKEHGIFREALTLQDLETFEGETQDPRALEDLRAFRTFIENYDYITQTPVSFHQRKMFLVGGGYTGGRYYSLSQKSEYLAQCEPRERVRYFDRIYLAMIDRTYIELDNPLLGNEIEIVDSPGMGAVYEIDSERSRQLLKESDAVVVVNKEVGSRDSADVTRSWIEGIISLKEELDRGRSLRGETEATSIADRMFFVWNKIDRVERSSLDEICPMFFDLIPLDNPQVRFTSGRAYFDPETQGVLREKFGTDGGGTRFSEIAEQLRLVAGDDDPGGILSLRRDLIEHGQSRAHHHKLTDVKEVFERNLRSMEVAIRPEREKVELCFGDPDMVRRTFVKSHLDQMAVDLFGSADRERSVVGRLEVFGDGYLVGQENSPYANRVDNEYFLRERQELIARIRDMIRRRMREFFLDLDQNFVPTSTVPSFTIHDAKVGLERAVDTYRRELSRIAQRVVGERVSEKLRRVLDYDRLVERLRRLLPINQDRISILRDGVQKYRQLVEHSIGGRVHEELASAPRMQELKLDNLKKAEGQGRSALVGAVQREFEDVYLTTHLAQRVLPRLREVIHNYLRYDLELTTAELRPAWSLMTDYVLQPENLRCVDLKELAESEAGNEQSSEALQVLRIGEFVRRFREAQEKLSALGAEFGRLDPPPARPHKNWLRTSLAA